MWSALSTWPKKAELAGLVGRDVGDLVSLTKLRRRIVIAEQVADGDKVSAGHFAEVRGNEIEHHDTRPR